MFMLFAGILTATGGTSLIMKLSLAAVGHLRAGPAQVAVVSSALFGMISGSTVANVAAQGPYTIPTMRKTGFSAEFAGAIEAVSSTGGQITPPVLGLTAFLIVGLTGIAYVDVMVATVFPAAIFYLYMMINIHIEAICRGIGPLTGLKLAARSSTTCRRAAPCSSTCTSSPAPCFSSGCSRSMSPPVWRPSIPACSSWPARP
jgi:TRAP-type uncharacterized transport system fused permease subunit